MNRLQERLRDQKLISQYFKTRKYVQFNGRLDHASGYSYECLINATVITDDGKDAIESELTQKLGKLTRIIRKRKVMFYSNHHFSPRLVITLAVYQPTGDQ